MTNDRLEPWIDGSVLRETERIDLAIYRAIAATPSPALDDVMRTISDAANRSRLWLTIAAGMALVGGRRGRRAALAGVGAIAVSSLVVNLQLKYLLRRDRPDREGARVPVTRHVPMPTTSSFPSGHSASGFAFAAGVAGSLPGVAAPLRLLASTVAYARVHTGVHYPADVVVGALIGTTIGETVAFLDRHRRRAREAQQGTPDLPG
jgi:undecaprenyl-diphosphatase